MVARQLNREQDQRLEILNTLLTTPHRKLAEFWPVHQKMIDADPRFYVRLGAWYNDHGDVRDHKEMFVIALALSPEAEHRDVGLALLRQLPPYEVGRVLDFINGRKKTRKVKAGDAAPVVENIGLFRNPPRSLKTEITRYLREREADADWFDSTALVARKSLKRLYALLHVAPGARAQQILFDEEPPADSRLFALKQLRQAKTPAEQAQAIIDLRIPYRVAVTVVQQMTPTVLLALIDRMTPQELINNLGSLQRRGAFANADLKAFIEEKLVQAKTATRVSAFKAEEAKKATRLSNDVQRKLDDVADAQVKAKGRIQRPTALLIDKSGSMAVAIELGKRIGAMVSAICERDLFVYAFDTLAYPIDRAGEDLAAWEKALKGVRAGGSTSCGVALDMLARKRQYVEQIIMITDEGENAAPFFVSSYKKYCEVMKSQPNVCFVRTPNSNDYLEQQCRSNGVSCDAFQFTGDYYALPNLAALLSRPSKLELLLEIIDYPLPKRSG